MLRDTAAAIAHHHRLCWLEALARRDGLRVARAVGGLGPGGAGQLPGWLSATRQAVSSMCVAWATPDAELDTVLGCKI